MNRKLLTSLVAAALLSLGAVGAVVASSIWTANQNGFHQEAVGQAARLTIRVEAGIVDPNSQLLPDAAPAQFSVCPVYPCGPGGALDFSIQNTGNFPVRVTGLAIGGTCNTPTGLGCIGSNKNTDGTFTFSPGGSCGAFAFFVPPANFNAWPVIPGHATLQVNGTDGSQLGAGMLHLVATTPSPCQGASFEMPLVVTAADAS